MTTAFLALALAAAPQWGRSYQDPATYVSRSGVFELRVDPPDRGGEGVGTHALFQRGRKVRELDLPFTLDEAVVADDGTVAGYANTENANHLEPDEVHVVIYGADGSLRKHEVVPRPMHVVDGPAVPEAQGLVLDDAHDRVIVRVYANRKFDPWWIYRLSDGSRLPDVEPESIVKPPGGLSIGIREARPIAGTPLLLVRWGAFDPSDFSMGYFREGALYTLLDLEWKTVWSLCLPRDFTVENDERADDALEALVESVGPILATGERSFALWHVKERARVDYRVEETQDGGFAAREVGRTPFEPPPEGGVVDATLRALGSVRLHDEEVTRGPIHDVAAYVLEEDGSIGFARSEAGGVWSAVWIDRDGGLLAEQRLAPFAPSTQLYVQWLLPRGGPWLACVNDFDVGHLRVWRAFPREGRTEFVGDVDCPGCTAGVSDMAAAPSGGFVTLGGRPTNAGEALRSFGPNGELLWQKLQSGYSEADLENPAVPMSLTEVHVLDDGRIAVASAVKETLQVWQPDGTFSHVLRLSEILGREFTYPSDLSRDVDGGVLYEDSASPHFWRVGLDGTVRGSFDALAADGRAMKNVRVAPDGTLWSCDGQFFYELDEQGVVARTLGEPAPPEALHDPHVLGIDSRGLLHVQDTRTNAVHVFRRDGERVGLVRWPTDVLGSLHAAPGGDRYAEGRGNQAVFTDLDGNELGRVTLFEELESSGFGEQNAAFERGTSRRYEYDEDQLLLCGAAGEVVARHERRPGDRRWLRIDDVAVAPDGSAAVLTEGSNYGFRGETKPGLALFTRDGKPLRTVELPQDGVSQVVTNGRWVALSRWDPVVLLVDQEDDSIRRCTLGTDVPRGSWFPFFPPGENELWMVETADREVHLHRFALPE